VVGDSGVRVGGVVGLIGLGLAAIYTVGAALGGVDII
jgi:hypothetical protein